MKKLLILALVCLVLFAGCKEKSENKLENEQIQAVEDSAETESSLEQEVDSVDTDDSQDAVVAESENTENEQLLSFEDEIPQFDAVETLYYPATVELAMEEETELLKTQDFAISIAIKSKEEGKDRPTYYCDYYITDSEQNKNLLFSSDFPYIGEVENPIYPSYEFLNREKPLVKADINNNGIDDYIFVVKADRSRDMIAFEKKNSAYKEILKWFVFVDGGPENDDIAESIIFNSGESKNRIIIDYAPYNRRSVLAFDESAYEYKRDEHPSYKMKVYVPKKPFEIKQFGTHELAVSEDRIYFKNQDEYLKIYFSGDSESWGYFSCNADNIKIYDIDESSFIVHLNFEKTESYGDEPPCKDQFYLIFLKDNQWCINKTEERYINSIGIHHEENETVEIQSVEKEEGAMKIYYSVGGKSAETVIDMDNPKYY